MSRNVGGGRQLGSKNAVHVRLAAERRREPTVNTEELRHFLDSAQTGDGEWRPEPDLDGEGLRRRRDTIWLTDDDGCSLQVDEDDAALMVAALRSNQLQVIERDRLDVERAAIAAAARLEGEVSDLRTQLAACSEAYVQLQVIERDRLARALAEVEHAAGCNDPETVDWASRRGYESGHPVTAHLPAMLRKADAIIQALDSTTGDERG